MGIEIAASKKKCNLCNKLRSQRYCLRYGKDICWVCCNSKRIDKKCPRECQYILQKADYAPLPHLQAKVDSYAEQLGLHKLQIDVWAELPEKQFEGQIPAEMAKTDKGKKQLELFIQKIPPDHPQTIEYLRKKFKLPPAKIAYSHYEDNAMAYLDHIIEYEWEKTITMISGNDKYDNKLYRNNYLKRRTQNRLLNRMTDYHLILSAISEKKDEALVYFEINHKHDLTINLVKEARDWKVKMLMLDSPQVYYGLQNIENQIIAPLSKNKLDEAGKLLKKYAAILIDSPEIFYLYGLYYSLKEDYQNAQAMFLNCVELNPGMYEYRYNFAFTSQAAGDLTSSKKIYQQLLQEKPDDLKTINNLAVIELNQKNISKAIELWEKCLQIDNKFELAKKNIERFKYAKPNDLENN